MIRHVALLKFSPEATREQVDAFAVACRALPDQIEGVRRFSCGATANSDPAAASHDFAIVADFDDLASYRRYATHEHHQDVIVNHLRPILADRAAVQYEI